MSVNEQLETALRPSWFPVAMHEMAAQKRFVAVGTDGFAVGELHVRAVSLCHPQGVTAYRITGPNNSLVVATDYERGDLAADTTLRSLATEASVLAHDAQCSPTEYRERYSGWGHSTWADAAEAARDADVEQLLLASHAPERTDEEIDEFVDNARHGGSG